MKCRSCLQIFAQLTAVLAVTMAAKAQAGGPLKVGDEFFYQSQVRRDGEYIASDIIRRVSEVADSETTFEVITVARGQRSSVLERRDASMNIIETGNLRFTPFLDLFRFPFEIGIRRYVISRLQKDSGRVLTLEGEVRTEPMSELTVAAGKFQVHEVIANGRFVEPGTGASTKYQTRVWFAPSIMAIVKQEFYERNREDTGFYVRGSQELVRVKQ